MGKLLAALTPELEAFIAKQVIYFTGTAAPEGTVNVSPKGMDSLRVLAPNRVVWLNYTGSGNETAAHLQQLNRITLMFCSFEEKPLILRLYGTAQNHYVNSPLYNELIELFPTTTGARQVIDMQINKVQTSCGFGVPYMEYKGERNTLLNWADKKGDEGIRDYWKAKNARSLDGFDTGL